MQPTDIQAQQRVVIASTTSLLSASGGGNDTYTSAWYDANVYSKIDLVSISDVPASAVRVQFSSDAQNIDDEAVFYTQQKTIEGNTRYCLSIAEQPLPSRYVRIKYENGATNQTIFRLTALARVI